MGVFISLLTPLFLTFSSFAQTTKPFRLHLLNEPTHIDPQLQQSAASNYLVQNLHRNLFKYDDKKGLIADLGMNCKRSQKQMVLTCELKKNLKWSDGSPLTATHFLNAYERLLDAKVKAPRADLLFKIKNAKAIYLGEKKGLQLGIKAVSSNHLRFEFSQPDPDFEYNLANVILAPWKDERSFSGPYQLDSWIKGKKITLKNNPHYQLVLTRPDVEFYFISEDTIALKLYEKNQLDFLRRLPSLYIPQYKKNPEFQWLQVIRFDYFGFGPHLKAKSELRKALSLSLNYEELQKIFSAEGRPGCSGLPASWTQNKEICLHFLPAQAKTLKTDTMQTDLKLIFSLLGGEDHRRAAEWMQSQWKQNLGFNVQVKGLENKLFIAELYSKAPDIFRKGVALDRPTCFAALETFATESDENFIQLKDAEYQKNLVQLSTEKNPEQKKLLCERGIRYLLDNYFLIPTGPIHFALLAKPTFSGWRLNMMNQLDLSELKESVSK